MTTLYRIQKFVKRGEEVNGPAGPIIVCTRNNDLQGVLDSTPEDRRNGEAARLLDAVPGVVCKSQA